MSEYRVVKFFTDLQDNNYKYNAGDIFPRKGLKVSEERLAELSGYNNRQHKPLIEKIDNVPEETVEKSKPRTTRKRRAKE